MCILHRWTLHLEPAATEIKTTYFSDPDTGSGNDITIKVHANIYDIDMFVQHTLTLVVPSLKFHSCIGLHKFANQHF
jgi:hypothetical protein